MCSVKKVLFEILLQLPATSLQLACNFIKKGTLTQVFSCEFCEIFKNTFFKEYLLKTVSFAYILDERSFLHCLMKMNQSLRYQPIQGNENIKQLFASQ